MAKIRLSTFILETGGKRRWEARLLPATSERSINLHERQLRAEAAALQAWMNPRGGRIPELPVCLDKRLDLARRELEALFAQGGERFERLPNELKPQIFVGDYSTDERLNRFLRHGA